MWLIVYSANAEKVCTNSSAALPDVIPEVSPEWWTVCFAMGTILTIETSVTTIWVCKKLISYKLYVRSRSSRIPTSFWIVLVQGFASGFFAAFSFLGTGAHHPRDFDTVHKMIWTYCLGSSCAFLSASLWLDSARRLILAASAIRAAHRAARFNKLIVFASSPAFVGAFVSVIAHGLPEFRCLPFTSFSRIHSIFVFFSIMTSCWANLYYLRRSLKLLRRVQTGGSVQLHDSIQKLLSLGIFLLSILPGLLLTCVIDIFTSMPADVPLYFQFCWGYINCSCIVWGILSLGNFVFKFKNRRTSAESFERERNSKRAVSSTGFVSRFA